jgi:hypothetical protein
MFDERAMSTVNEFLLHDATKERRDKFQRLFTQIDKNNPVKSNYIAPVICDKSFHLASIYGNELLTPDGVKRVAHWLSTAPKEQVEEFKEVMGVMRCTSNFTRPTSHTHSEFKIPPQYMVDKTLQRTSRQVVEDREYVSFLDKTRKERNTKRKEEERRKEKTGPDPVETYKTLQATRPTTAPAQTNRNFHGKKPYATSVGPLNLISTNKDTFISPVAQMNRNRVNNSSTDLLREAIFRPKPASFIPKAIMTTAAIGTVAPESDTSYLPYDELEKYKKSNKFNISIAEELKNPPRVSKSLGVSMSRSMYTQQFSSPAVTARTRPITQGSTKSPYGHFPTVEEFSKTTEYNNKYHEKQDVYSLKEFDKRERLKRHNAKKHRKHRTTSKIKS